jgi:hypothetical protein
MVTIQSLSEYPLIYLATPYSRYAWGIGAAYVDACKLASALIKHGVSVYSPIAHTHGIAIFGGLEPLNVQMWLKFDESMMRACDALVVGQLLGWAESYGVSQEIAYFDRTKKPVFFLDPSSLHIDRTPILADMAAPKLAVPLPAVPEADSRVEQKPV